jgi:cytochrome c peroxidase
MRTLYLLGAGALGLAAAACSGRSDAQPAAQPAPPTAQPAAGGSHGAAPFSEQEQRLAALIAGGDPAAVPKWLDPVIWAASIPKDNEPNAARLALGKKLYFEARLSADGSVACATCHDSTRSFTDRRNASEGIGGKVGARNAPTSMNAVLLHSQFWDGRADNVEAQALLPIINSIEMGHPDGKAAAAAIAGDAEYEAMFQAAYGRGVNYDDIGRAIATFERTLIFLDAPFDRWAHGDAKAIGDDAKLGFELFTGKARCVACHPFNAANPLGSDGRFHNIGVSARHQDFGQLASKALAILAQNGSEATIDELALGGSTSELGRFVVSRIESDIGGFRTPQLRNIGITGPYMHDGSMQTLWDVMDHYNKGGEPNPYLDGGIEPLALSDAEIDQLVAFMFTLTDVRFADDNQRELDAQRTTAAAKRPFRDDDVAQRRKIVAGSAK